MFNCIKTGFYARIPSGAFLYGDAFGLPGIDWPDHPVSYPHAFLLLRVTCLSTETPSYIHIVLDTWAHWFEEHKGQNVSDDPNERAVVWTPCSTLIANPGDWSWLGYEGVAP